MERVQTLVYDSWRQFKSDLNADLFASDTFQPSRYIFRGQREAEWKLTSHFDRWCDLLGVAGDRPRIYQNLYREFRDQCRHCHLSSITDDELETLAYGQHYGLPTPLLDWTESPYVAAFFAFCDLMAMRQPGDSVAVWALDTESTAWSVETGVSVIRSRRSENARLRNQFGCFTLSKTPFRCLEEYLQHAPGTDLALRRILISASEGPTALRDLESMGITHDRMFPEVEGLARAAQSRVALEIFRLAEERPRERRGPTRG